MNKGIRNIVVLLIIIGFSLGLDQFLEYGLKRNNNIKESYSQRGEINADILVHGPCEVIWTINPDIIEEVTGKASYNISHVHSDFATNYLTLVQYLKENKSPEKLLLFVTPESFDKRYNTFHPYLFSLYNDSITKQILRDRVPTYALFHKLPLIRFTYYNRLLLFPALQGWKHEFERKHLPYFENGYEPPKKMKWDNHYEELFKLYPSGVKFDWNLEREYYFLKIVELCKKEGIQLIAYESPILDSSKPGQLNRNERLAKIDSLCSKHHVSFWEFDNHPLCKDKKNFFSSLNLHIEAGNEFTRDLAKKLINH